MGLSTHLPEAFDFYSLGHIKLTQTPPTASACMTKVLITGDLDATVLIRFDTLPSDASMCLELTNLLTAKIVNSMCDAGGLFLELSPPAFIDAEEKAYESLLPLFKVSGSMPGSARRSYQLGGTNNLNIKMELVYLPQRRGNA